MRRSNSWNREAKPSEFIELAAERFHLDVSTLAIGVEFFPTEELRELSEKDCLRRRGLLLNLMFSNDFGGPSGS